MQEGTLVHLGPVERAHMKSYLQWLNSPSLAPVWEDEASLPYTAMRAEPVARTQSTPRSEGGWAHFTVFTKSDGAPAGLASVVDLNTPRNRPGAPPDPPRVAPRHPGRAGGGGGRPALRARRSPSSTSTAFWLRTVPEILWASERRALHRAGPGFSAEGLRAASTSPGTGATGNATHGASCGSDWSRREPPTLNCARWAPTATSWRSEDGTPGRPGGGDVPTGPRGEGGEAGAGTEDKEEIFFTTDVMHRDKDDV